MDRRDDNSVHLDCVSFVLKARKNMHQQKHHHNFIFAFFFCFVVALWLNSIADPQDIQRNLFAEFNLSEIKNEDTSSNNGNQNASKYGT